MGYEAMKDAPMYIDQIEKAVQSAIEAKMSAERFELELLRNMRSRSGQFKATMSGTQNDPKVIEAALCLATGLPNIEKHYNEKTLEAVDRCGLRQISLQQVLLQAAATNGYSCRAGERITGGNLRAVLKACFSDEATARLGFSTVSLPNILGAVANKQILAGYMEEDNDLEGCCDRQIGFQLLHAELLPDARQPRIRGSRQRRRNQARHARRGNLHQQGQDLRQDAGPHPQSNHQRRSGRVR
jgi:hypothetical protein